MATSAGTATVSLDDALGEMSYTLHVKGVRLRGLRMKVGLWLVRFGLRLALAPAETTLDAATDARVEVDDG